MYTFKIINVETAFYQASNTNVIEVEAEIFKDDESVGSKKFAYDLGTTKETILEELEKVCATLGSDEDVASSSAALEESLAEVESLKNELLAPAKDEEVTA